ncbi:winged helix-turn-helix domain-containing protein [Ewingella americana]|uniref:winged helix-turn-helix domain-containing protein n=1 Tax=Ewingella americana TaxID=41202 RepID=UPI0012AD7A21|nr:winged helix-turn-helix domain-containing protein [Ewingella americana]MRT04175.1 hypothetical protein [Ewingella americana]
MSSLINGWRLDSSLNAITHSVTGETKRLGEYQFALLSLLQEHPDQVLLRETLIQHAWKSRVVGHNSLPNAIHALRNALGDDGKNQQIIKTIPKKGYLLDSQFLSVDEQPEVQSTWTAPEPEEIPAPSPAPTPSVTELPPAEKPLPSATQPKKTPRRGRLWISGVVAVVALLAVWKVVPQLEGEAIAGAKESVTEQLDSRFSAKNIQVFTLIIPNETSLTNESKPLAPILQNQLTRIDSELDKRQARMQMRYHLSPDTMTLNLRLTSQCNINSQLVMEVHNWVQYPEKLAQLVYKESVRTLNDLPNCP